MSIGLALGILIGIITGTVFLLLLRSARRLSEKDRTATFAFTAQLLLLPGFWFGGPWLTGALLRGPLASIDDGQSIVQPYLLGLIVAFALFSVYPAMRWIIQLGEEFGKPP